MFLFGPKVKWAPKLDIPATVRVWRYRTSYPERSSYAVKLTFPCLSFRENP